MMKALLFCPVSGNAWVKRYFRDQPVCLLPFANKPAIEFALDYCFLCGIRDVRIISDEETDVLRMQYRRGEMLGMNLSYCGVQPTESSLKRIVRRNIAFCRGGDLLLLSGLFLPEYDKHKPEALEIGAREMKGRVCGDGSAAWYLIGRDMLDELPDDWSGFHDDVPVCGSPVPGIREYYELNMRMTGSDKYNLPGFSMGKNSFVGRDIRIPGSTRIRPPVIIGNGVEFGRGSNAGPNIVVGDNCVIDSGTTLRNSVVFGGTYIGRDLEIDGKICCGNTVIDPESGIAVEISRESLFSRMEPDEYVKCPLGQRVMAFLLFLLQTLPYTLLRPFLEFHATLAECLTSSGEKRIMSLHRQVLPRESLAERIFRRLSLDKYHLLPHAAAGRLRLIGNCLLEATEHNERFVRELPGYAPGIFSYSEYLGHENEPCLMELDEQYYTHVMNCWFNIKILTGTLRHNLRMAGRSLRKGATE